MYYDMLVEHRLSHEAAATYPDDQDPLMMQASSAWRPRCASICGVRGAGMVGLPPAETWPFGDPPGKDRHLAMAYVLRYYRMCERMGCADREEISGELWGCAELDG